MMMAWLSLLGWLGVVVALGVLLALSRRFGSVTQAPPYYRVLYLSIGMVLTSVLVRMWHLGQNMVIDISENWLWVLSYNGLPSLGLVVALWAAWHYWSWLLAERD
jgi:hypothetical protein